MMSKKKQGKATLASKICGAMVAGGMCVAGLVSGAQASQAGGNENHAVRVEGAGSSSNCQKNADKAKKTVGKQSIIIPAYKYPEQNDQFWNTVVALGRKSIPYVVVNPSSGVGQAPDQNYARQISKNAAAGIKNIGYIRTDYQRRPIADVQAEVDNYYAFYGEGKIHGFFFDETDAKTPQQTQYLAMLYKYVKSKHADKLVIANFGAPNVTNNVIPYADVFVTAEYSADKYVKKESDSPSPFDKDPENSKHIMHIVYAASTHQYKEIIRISRQRNASWLYVTTDTLDNPYDQLPENMQELAKEINNLGMPDDPRRK